MCGRGLGAAFRARLCAWLCARLCAWLRAWLRAWHYATCNRIPPFFTIAAIFLGEQYFPLDRRKKRLQMLRKRCRCSGKQPIQKRIGELPAFRFITAGGYKFIPLLTDGNASGDIHFASARSEMKKASMEKSVITPKMISNAINGIVPWDFFRWGEHPQVPG